MFRIKFLALLSILAATLLWPLQAAAQAPDPNACLPDCYAYNKADPGGNGTQGRPWGTTDLAGLRQKMGSAVKGRRNYGALLVTNCDNAQPVKCTAILYTYLRDGSESSQSVGPVPVPSEGAPLPFPYVLGGTALLGVLLLGVGMTLRRRARNLKL